MHLKRTDGDGHPLAINRREFLKAAAAGVLAGLAASRDARFCVSPRGDISRPVATWLGEYPNGGAVCVSGAGGRSLAIEPDAAHPLPAPRDAAYLEDVLRQVEDPRRLSGPYRQRLGNRLPVSWAEAIRQVAAIFTQYRPEQVAFVLGAFPDHLNDLARRLPLAGAGMTVLRFSYASLRDGRVTLQDAAQRLFGLPRLPFFDLEHADRVFAFGVTGGEPWVGRRKPGQEWVDVELSTDLTGLRSGVLYREPVRSALYIPGARALAQANGLAAGQAILALNALSGNLGQPGGVFLPVDSPVEADVLERTATVAEAIALLERIRIGQVKALFVHGVDLLQALPEADGAAGAADALQKLEKLVSFNPLYDQTARLAHLLLPDRLPLESWGYQRVTPAADRPLAAAIQPALAPRGATCPTADVLLAAARLAGMPLPFINELDFIQQAVQSMRWGAEPQPWERWLTQGGWWTQGRLMMPAVSILPPQRLAKVGDGNGGGAMTVQNESGDWAVWE